MTCPQASIARAVEPGSAEDARFAHEESSCSRVEPVPQTLGHAAPAAADLPGAVSAKDEQIGNVGPGKLPTKRVKNSEGSMAVGDGKSRVPIARVLVVLLDGAIGIK